ncbi:Probable N6-adenosine-methyltransferase MT-A70-like protein [Eumeta japonica]|uniref:mRNA m(6)A methyltransferase n=1 Tax=Eumeta variegata TaxID=151549 RepID=A0A4C1W1Y9_EUMVA|nr:Probable N6-adenosine-methyltransferase MT-A70-like protein [Eumeta japonica]
MHYGGQRIRRLCDIGLFLFLGSARVVTELANNILSCENTDLQIPFENDALTVWSSIHPDQYMPEPPCRHYSQGSCQKIRDKGDDLRSGSYLLQTLSVAIQRSNAANMMGTFGPNAWEEIQAVKSKRNSLREKLEKRKKERQNILGATLSGGDKQENSNLLKQERNIPSPATSKSDPIIEKPKLPVPLVSLEVRLLQVLCDMQLQLPATVRALLPGLGDVDAGIVDNLLQKFATQKLISIRERTEGADGGLEVLGAEAVRLGAVLNALLEENITTEKRKGDKNIDEGSTAKIPKSNTEEKKSAKNDTDIMSLLSMPSSREKAVKRVGEEIMDLLSKPTAKERSLADKFKSQGGAQVMEFCPHGTRGECVRAFNAQKQASSEELGKENTDDQNYSCKKLHFRKIIQSHTDESLGDCSFLNTCFHMDSCKYVHYEVDNTDPNATAKQLTESASKTIHNGASVPTNPSGVLTLTPPQWIQCDLRYLDMTFLGKFAVIMADPPWDIHMELPYGTMSDDEMRCLGVPQLQDEGLIFLWVTGRAMELGRECLKLWGYERVDELIWVKTNQLQRIIRTGRTGHWLNHGKEHCLVGMKGDPQNLNRGLDCDVIVAEVRATSHKPDEIYGIIGEWHYLFCNENKFNEKYDPDVSPDYYLKITLGNQVNGVQLVDPDLIAAFKKRYPDGNCMAPPGPESSLT